MKFTTFYLDKISNSELYFGLLMLYNGFMKCCISLMSHD